MVTIDLNGNTINANQFKLRKNPDEWHDIVIPGLRGKDGTVTVPGTTREEFDPAKQRVLRRLNKKTIVEKVKRKELEKKDRDNRSVDTDDHDLEKY